MSSSLLPRPGGARTAIAFLSFAWHCVLKKAGGLSEEQLRRILVDSGTCMLGLVQHLAETERHWFGYHLAGAALDAGREYGMTVSTGRAAGDVLRDYRAAIEDSDQGHHRCPVQVALGPGRPSANEPPRPTSAEYWLERTV